MIFSETNWKSYQWKIERANEDRRRHPHSCYYYYRVHVDRVQFILFDLLLFADNATTTADDDCSRHLIRLNGASVFERIMHGCSQSVRPRNSKHFTELPRWQNAHVQYLSLWRQSAKQVSGELRNGMAERIVGIVILHKSDFVYCNYWIMHVIFHIKVYLLSNSLTWLIRLKDVKSVYGEFPFEWPHQKCFDRVLMCKRSSVACH